MNFSISGEEQGVYYLITLKDEFNVKAIKKTRETIENAIFTGNSNFIFDMSEVTFIDSGGIGLLMNLHKKLEKEQGGIALVGLSDSMKEAMQSSNALIAIPCFEDLRGAEAEIG